MANSRGKISREMNKIFANSVENYLEVHKLAFKFVDGFDPNSNRNDITKIREIENKVLHATMLKDRHGMLMAVIPASHLLNLQALNHLLERDLVPVHFNELKTILFGCNTGMCPPLPDIYGTDVVFDHSIEYMPKGEIYFSSGVKNKYVKMDLEDFKKLHSNINYEIFSEPVSELTSAWEGLSPNQAEDVIKNFVHKRMKGRIKEIKEFPAMPPLAEAILQLRIDESATAKDLAAIIERDPSLSAQVMAWSRSAFYGYKGEVTTVEEAIVKVLGFELVMNLVMCICVGKSLHMPIHGPIGLTETWRTGLYVSVIVDTIVKIMPPEKRPKKGYAFLAGLVHNFGYLLLGHVFPKQFDLLNNMLSCNTHIPVTKVEQHTLGVSHEHLGMWLMKQWNLPDEVVSAICGHHREDFINEHKVYANLILIALRLLKRHNIGDEKVIEIPDELVQELGIDMADLNNVLEQVMLKKDDLDDLISCLLK